MTQEYIEITISVSKVILANIASNYHKNISIRDNEDIVRIALMLATISLKDEPFTDSLSAGLFLDYIERKGGVIDGNES